MIRRLKKYISIALIAAGMLQVQTVAAQVNHTVVIDAGHGGKDVGAVDNGKKEKDINLGVALKLADELKKTMKNMNVVLTRDNDTFISLQERADIANKAKGNLFISIHTNSLDKNNKNRKTAEGTSVYVLGLHKDQNNMKVAQRENSVIELEKDYAQKYSGFDPSKDESYIIFEMAQKSNLSHSFKFANEAQKQLVAQAARKDRGVKQAGFWVLWATSMPAVLVELDFICNPTSAEFMGSEEGQKKMAKSLAKAVENYFKSAEKQTATPELRTVEEKSKQPATAPARNRNTSNGAAQRRRRSTTAKADSNSRPVAVADIPLHSEKEHMPIIAEIKESEETYSQNIPSENNQNNKKSKKDKKKNSKKNVVTLAESKRKSGSEHRPKTEKISTVYKIQILASEELLKTNNPRFCGLSPVTAFKEKNLYKYTYGESTNKKEIETLLKDVKRKIPDAFIIESRK